MTKIGFNARLVIIALFLLTGINAGFAFGNWPVTPPVQENKPSVSQPADIEVFVRAGCPHCEKAKLFLDKLKQENPKLNIVVHDLAADPAELGRLQTLAKKQGETALRVPAFSIGDQLIIGFSDEDTTGKIIRNALEKHPPAPLQPGLEGCGVVQNTECMAKPTPLTVQPEAFELSVLGYKVSLEQVGLPLFTLAMGLLDGFNPCSLWVLLLMISLLAPMKDRMRMFAVAGSFIIVEGLAYFLFMTAWLNLFLLIGLSRISEIILAMFALLAGAIHLKDFWFYGRGISLSIPDSAKPGIYARMRGVLSATNLGAAIIGAVLLAVLVQIVELMCTSGFPALYTRILTLSKLDKLSYYSYLLLYNIAYMFDDLVILTIGIVTLSQKRLQENEGRWLKLISGLVMAGLGLYLIFVPA